MKETYMFLLKMPLSIASCSQPLKSFDVRMIETGIPTEEKKKFNRTDRERINFYIDTSRHCRRREIEFPRRDRALRRGISVQSSLTSEPEISSITRQHSRHFFFYFHPHFATQDPSQKRPRRKRRDGHSVHSRQVAAVAC